ncbi:MAG: GTP 3',8-cyclase MoaA [Candidatus Dormibacteraceae bacterium]
MVTQLIDSYGRRADDLRISVTDRCNFRCVYCMPAVGVKWLPRQDLLTDDEILRLAQLFINRYGVRTIRLTGGEPLLRSSIIDLVADLAHLHPDLDLTMTTNGMLLSGKAERLKAAGLKRLNVSLDTLHAERFQGLARRKGFERVMEGLAAATAAEFSPIKLNVVVMRDKNDDEAVDFARLARERGYLVRFIEFMPLDGEREWSNALVVPSQQLTEQIEAEFPLIANPSAQPGPADNWRFADGAPGGVGFISSVSQAFCSSCNRIRLSAEGGLRSCLFSLQETPLRELLRRGASDDELAAVIEAAIWRKEEGHQINQEGFVRPIKYMSQIGG